MKTKQLLSSLVLCLSLTGCVGSSGEHVHSFNPLTGDCECGEHQHVYESEYQTNAWSHRKEPICHHEGNNPPDILEDHNFDEHGVCTICHYDGGEVKFKHQPYTPTNAFISESKHYSSGGSEKTDMEKIGNDILICYKGYYTYFKYQKEDIYLLTSLASDGKWYRFGLVTLWYVYQNTPLLTLWNYAVEGSAFNTSSMSRTGVLEDKEYGMTVSQFQGTNSSGAGAIYVIAEEQNLTLQFTEGSEENFTNSVITELRTNITSFSIEVPKF